MERMEKMDWYFKLEEAVNIVKSVSAGIVVSTPHLYEGREIKRYTVFYSYEELENFIFSLKKDARMFDEVKIKDGIYKLHLDIDIKINLDDDRLFQSVIRKIEAGIGPALIKCFPDAFDPSFIIKDSDITILTSNGQCSSSEYKFSAHIILPWYGTIEHCHLFNIEISNIPGIKEYVDVLITKGSNKSLRLPGCSKLSEYKRWITTPRRFADGILTVLNPKMDDDYDICHCPLDIDDSLFEELDQYSIAYCSDMFPGLRIENGSAVRVTSGYCPVHMEMHEVGGVLDDYAGSRAASFFIRSEHNKKDIMMKCYEGSAKIGSILEYISVNEISEIYPANVLYKNRFVGGMDIKSPKCKITLQDFYSIFPKGLPANTDDIHKFVTQTIAIVSEGLRKKKIVAKVTDFTEMDNCSPFINYDYDTLAACREVLADYVFINENGEYKSLVDNLAHLVPYIKFINSPVSPLILEDQYIKRTFNIYSGPIAYHNQHFIEQMSGNELYEKILPILEHIRIIFCRSNEEEYIFFMSWLRHHILYPNIKTKILLIFFGCQGSGKSVFWEWFGEVVIGNDLFLKSEVERVIGAKFNALISGRKLILCEEIQGHGLKGLMERLKDQITANTMNIEDKGINTKGNCRDFVDYVFNTNNLNAISLEPGQRRFKVFNCSSEKSENIIGKSASYEYFDMFYKDKSIVGACFFKYLIGLNVPNLNDLSIPCNDIMKSIEVVSRPPVVEFLMDLYNVLGMDELFGNNSQTNTYNRYKEWAIEVGYGNKIMNRKNFTLAMDKLGLSCKKRRDQLGATVNTFQLSKENMILILGPYGKDGDL